MGAIGETFANLALSGPFLIAALVAAVAGALSFFSPCCLPLVPGYLSYVGGMAGADAHERSGSQADRTGASTAALTAVRPHMQRWRTAIGTALFVLGFAAVFTSYGALFGGLGRMLIAYQDVLIRGLGVVTILLGLAFTGWLSRIPLLGRNLRLSYTPKVGLAGAPVLGVIFGLGWTPCIGPTLAAVLTLAVDSSSASRGAGLAFAYSLGLGVPFLIAGIALAKATRVFGFFRRHAHGLKVTGGLFLVALGALQVSGLWGVLIRSIQGWVAGFQLPV